MSTTGRSESMNAFFDGYVNSKTTLKQFVEQYENALRKKIEKETQSDFESLNKQLQMATSYPMERQVHNLYTKAKFKEFQTELMGMVYCLIVSIDEAPPQTKRYVISEDIFYGDGGKKKAHFNVCYNGLDVQCSCSGFEFRGIVCRHALTVLNHNGEYYLPAHYLFPRWRKDLRRRHTRVKINYEGWIESSGQRRYEELCNSFASLADVGAENEERYYRLMELIVATREEFVSTPTVNTPVVAKSIVHDPQVTRSKGRPPSAMKKKIFKRRRNVGSSTQAGCSSTEGEGTDTHGVDG